MLFRSITGTCITAGGPSVTAAADFLVYALSTEAVSEVTRAGYLVPANQQVAFTDDFLQPGRAPEHASVYNDSVGDIQVMPPLDVWPALDAAVAPYIDEMFTVPVLDDLELLTTQIDEASQPVLAPEEGPTDPSESESDSESDSESGE